MRTQAGHTSLSEFRAAHNLITAIPPEFGLLTQLSQIFVSDNEIALLPAQFGSLSALRLLDLSYNKLTTLPTECFAKLSSLISLNLLKNELVSLQVNFSALNALQEIGRAQNLNC